MNKLTILISFLTLVSCRSEDQEKYFTIDDIRIGMPVDSFVEMNLNRQDYMLGQLYPYAIDRYAIKNLASAKAINLQGFDESVLNGKVSHRAILFPTQDNGKIAEVNVLICAAYSTAAPTSMGSRINQNVTTLSNSDVRKDVVDFIIRQYESKYGKPKILDLTFSRLYAIERGGITDYNSFESEAEEFIRANILVWETPEMKVTLNTGYKTNSYYSTIENGYVIRRGSRNNNSLRTPHGVVTCVAYPFINYKLKSEPWNKLFKDGDQKF